MIVVLLRIRIIFIITIVIIVVIIIVVVVITNVDVVVAIVIVVVVIIAVAIIQIEEQSGYTTISSIQLQQQRESAIDVEKALDNLKKVTQSSIVMYCQLHCTLYEPIWISEPTVNTDSEDIDMRLRVNVCGLHRIPINEFSK